VTFHWQGRLLNLGGYNHLSLIWGSTSDQGIKFCSNFKVLRMQRNQCHCVCLVFLIPTIYLLCQTNSAWRSYLDLFVKSNRQKKIVLTVQSVRSDVAGPYRSYDDVSGGDVATYGWLTVGKPGDDTCPLGGK
jgi:hypothetical protein